ncbi:MAG: hypothetical protein H6831_04630 [Planctomycetes bacterium]|nr:hypothetical protein [Planctomycetota bacterium]
MNLPFRIQSAPGDEPVIAVDGAWGAPGLNLSHWPGHTTPEALRHELSTGCALAFARLDPAQRADLSRGCVAVANNHADTDGICAAFAVLFPERALELEDELLAAAAAGDFFRPRDERALQVDLCVGAAVDAERSPWAEDFRGMRDAERWEAAYRRCFEVLPDWLTGDLEPWRALWEDGLADYRADRDDLAAATYEELVHFELEIHTAAPDVRSSRAGATAFDPGRHALFTGTATDRVLVVGPGAEGTTYRLIVNTTSWSDVPGRSNPPRPDLAALAARLDELEAEAGAPKHAWRAQSVTGAAPELWYGAPDLESFAEHNPVLRRSRLSPEVVRREVIEALRAVWVFPD